MDKNLLLDPSDFVGVSFWIISAAMVAATFFFFMERDRAVGKWKTSLSVAALVTGIAAMLKVDEKSIDLALHPENYGPDPGAPPAKGPLKKSDSQYARELQAQFDRL